MSEPPNNDANHDEIAAQDWVRSDRKNPPRPPGDAALRGRNLRRAQNHHGPMFPFVGRLAARRHSPEQLAEELFTDPNTVTAMVVRLEKRGLIRRDVCPEDGRARRVSLTSAGRRLVGRLYDDWAPMHEKLHKIFAGEPGEQALRILDEVRQVMTESRMAILEKRRKPSGVRRAANKAAVKTLQETP